MKRVPPSRARMMNVPAQITASAGSANSTVSDQPRYPAANAATSPTATKIGTPVSSPRTSPHAVRSLSDSRVIHAHMKTLFTATNADIPSSAAAT